MRIGVISDTHGQVNPRIATLFAGVDHILHAGDIGSPDVLDALRAIAPVTAVAGNVDHFRLGDAGVDARVTLGGLRFYLAHVIDRPHRLHPPVQDALAREPADVVVFGHSHLPHDEHVAGTWFFNPASAGPRRFDYPCSVGFFENRGTGWHAWHAALDERSERALLERMNQLSR